VVAWQDKNEIIKKYVERKAASKEEEEEDLNEELEEKQYEHKDDKD
jgi:hypothetical protein